MQSMANAAVGRFVVLTSATVGGLAMAIYFGRAVAQGQYQMLGMIFGAFIGLAIFLAIGRNAYIFLAIAVSLTGSIGILPLPFSYQELMIFGCFGITLAYLTFKKLRLETRTSPLDLILFVNLAYMVTVFMRNPVGLRAFGTEMIGGRPYLTVIASVLFYLAITQYKIPLKLAPKFPLIIAGPAIILSALAMAAFFIPGIGKIVYPFWTGVGLDRSVIEAAGGTASEATSGISRIPGSSLIGITTVQLLCAYFPVAHIISPMSPGLFVIFVAALVLWLVSGFRSGFIVYSTYLFFNCVLRRRFFDLIPAFLAGILLFSILIAGQGTLFNLPAGMQRSLSFLPGNWNHEAASDAEASTDWRINIWKEVWGNKEFIKNRWLGDGFGYSAYDLKIQIDAILGQGGYTDGTTAQMVSGAYHSGPLSTIRYVGAVGLLLYFGLQIGLLAYSIKLVRRAWGTPFQPITMFLAIPQLYGFVSFYLIFGGFDSDFPRSVFMAGLMKLVDLSMRDYQKDQRRIDTPISTSPIVPAASLRRAFSTSSRGH